MWVATIRRRRRLNRLARRRDRVGATESAELCVSICLGAAVCAFGARGGAADEGWILLFNGKNFEGWGTRVESTGKNNDATHVFKMEDGTVHILEVPTGGKFEKRLPLDRKPRAVARPRFAPATATAVEGSEVRVV
jgi:hypothetical protein